jgi:hypothetical protein
MVYESLKVLGRVAYSALESKNLYFRGTVGHAP